MIQPIHLLLLPQQPQKVLAFHWAYSFLDFLKLLVARKPSAWRAGCVVEEHGVLGAGIQGEPECDRFGGVFDDRDGFYVDEDAVFVEFTVEDGLAGFEGWMEKWYVAG